VDGMSLPSSVHKLTPEQEKHLDKFRDHKTLTIPKLREMVKELEASLQEYVVRQVKDMMMQLDHIKEKMTGINQHDHLPNLIAITLAMQSIFKQVREL
jgi:uncharacterized protein with von Willebrand factor type A (vWA) domain